MKKRIIATLLTTCIILSSCILGTTTAYAANTSLAVSANVYDLDKDSHYVIGEVATSKSAAIGTLSINGDVCTSSEADSFPAYEISNGNATFTYKIYTDYSVHRFPR